MRCLLLVLALASVQAQGPAREPVGPRSLLVTYSDGRTSPRILTPRGGSWTPFFPRRPEAPAHDGLPLSALKIDHVVEGDVVVTVSLLYGSPHQRTVQVAKVRVTGSEPVQVNELTDFGVDPITLSLVESPPVYLIQPSVASASDLLDLTVDLASPDQPVYKVTFWNRSPHSVMAVSYKFYRGGKQIGSGRKKTNRSTPIVEPNGEFAFTTPVGSATEPGFDRFEVTGVLWDDGSVDGDQTLRSSEQALTIGYAQQLRRVIALLKGRETTDGSFVRPTSVSQIRAAMEALPIEFEMSDGTALSAQLGIAPTLVELSVKAGQQQVKEAVLQDLDDYVRGRSGNSEPPLKPWLDDALVRYRAWLDRTGSL